MSFAPSEIEVKIGKGNLQSLRDILKVLTNEDNLISPIHIYLVDETGSSKQNGIHIQNIQAFYPGYKKSITRDEQAAIIIGYRTGEELTEYELEFVFNKEAQPAELKHIQRRSRKMSKGKLSLSRELANQVYLGNLTLEEAIEIQEKKANSKESRLEIE